MIQETQTGVIKVALVEDNEGVRKALENVVQGYPQLWLSGSYGSAEDGIVGLSNDPPDIVLVDINLPGKSGTALVAHMKRTHPSMLFLMITVYENADQVFAALQAGASGYLLKRTSADDIIEAILSLKNGGSPMSPEIARKVVHYFHKTGGPKDELDQLSKREEEILRLLSKGLRYKEIATQLNIGVETVRTHLQSVYQKLHVHSRTEAVVKFLGYPSVK
jgi:DNA-binding NarL/FixJ family response regulator